MRKMADTMSKAGKWLLVLSIGISNLFLPLQQVMADELESEADITVVEDVNTPVVEESTEVVVVDEVVDTPVIDYENTIVVDFEKLTGSEYEHTINVGDNTNVTFTLKNQDLVEVVSFDFSERLYGEYHYAFSGDKGLLVINYVGDNIELLNKYKNVSDLTKDFSCSKEECIISGFGADLVTVADITSKYFDVNSFETERNGYVSITDGERLLEADEKVINGYKLVISNKNDEKLLYASPASIYIINRVGDVHVPADGVIDLKDQETILDDIILEREVTSANDVNKDASLNILDATDSTFMNIYNGEEVSDVLTNTLTLSKEEILVGETVQVKLFVSGFNEANIYGIEGLLKYDDSILELIGVELYNINDSEILGNLNLENGKFAYVLNDGFNNSEEAILVLEFEAINYGESNISINNILESYGKSFEVSNDSVEVVLTVANPEDNKGGDEEEVPTPDEEDKTPEVETKPETDKEKEEDKKKPTTTGTQSIKSSDYYIKNLEIDGYEIDFDMYKFEYAITVGSEVDSLDIDVLLNNNNSIYYVEGNKNFTSGENLVHVVVRAENGSTKTYTIKVEKENEKEEITKDNADDSDDEEEAKNGVSKTIIIILIILVIIGLIYVIFKDDEEDEVKIEKVEKPKADKTAPEKSESVKKENKPTKNNKANNNTKKNTKNNSKKSNNKK